MTIWRMLISSLHTHTHRIRNTYCFSAEIMVTRMCLSVTLYVHCLSCSVIRKPVIETGFMCLPVCSLVTPRRSNRSIYTHNSRSYRLIQVEFNQIPLFTNNLNCHETELCKLYVVVLKRKHFQLIYILFTYLFIGISIHRMEKNCALKQMTLSLLVAYG